MDFNVFSTETLGRSAAQHVRDATLAAAASFSMLVAQQIVMKHTVNDFWTLGALLLAAFAVHTAVAFARDAVAASPSKRKIYSTTPLQLDTHTVPKLLANGARIFVQCWIRADALHHFGFLFAFLLEHVGVLLLQPLTDALRKQAHGSATTSSTWLLVLLGYVLVAGVDAYEYGSLLHTVALIGAALAAHAFAAHTPEARLHVAAAPQFHALSLLAASAIAVPLAVLVGAWRVQDEVLFNARTGVAPISAAAWTACIVAAAAAQTAAQHFAGSSSDVTTASRSRWLASMACCATGLIGSLVVSAAQDDWLRCAADALASLVILVALVIQLRHAPAATNGDIVDVELDMFRSSSSHTATSTSASATALRVVQLLWAADDSRKILLFLSVNVSYMFVELAVGVWTNSLGLIGDAGHMLVDNGALVIGLVASYIGKLPADAQYTYGYGRVEVLSGFLNSLVLLVISFHLLAEAAARFVDPPEVRTDNLLLTSSVGLGVNIVGLVWFHDHVHGHGHGDGSSCSGGSGGSGTSHGHAHGSSNHGHSHGGDSHGHAHGGNNSNMYGVYLHVLADTLGSVGVIISSLLIEYKGWHVADPLSSAMIALLIFGSTLPLLKATLLQLLQRVPHELERDIAKALDEVRTAVPGVVGVEQWHLWRHVNDVCVAAIHVAVDDSANEQLVVQGVRAVLKHRLALDEFLTVEVVKRSAGQLPLGLCSSGSYNGVEDHCSSTSVSGMSTFENPAGDDALRIANRRRHQQLHHGGVYKHHGVPDVHVAANLQVGNEWKFGPTHGAPVAAVHRPLNDHECGSHGHSHGHNHKHSHGHSHGHSH